MSYIVSPNMQLPIPTVGQEGGPQYAQDINNSLTNIDQHDHSPGRGVQITPAGMNINASLSMNSNPLLSLTYASFTALSSATSTVQSVSVAPSSSINELWYTDSNGTQTQITKNGVVNATASSIPGESYDAGTFIWVQGTGSTTPANFDIGSIILRPSTAGTTNGVTLSPPSGISSAYSVALPTLPSTNPAFLTIATNGAMASSVSTVNGIQRTMLASVGQQISSSCGAYTTSGGGEQAVTNLSVTITTSGRPVMLMLRGDGTMSNFNFVSYQAGTGSTVNEPAILFSRSSTTIANYVIATPTASSSSTLPSSSFSYLDTPSAGTYTYSVSALPARNSDTISVNYTVLVAYEL